MGNIFNVRMAKRLAVYCLGLFCMALGVSFSVKSNLGVSPVNSIPKVLSDIFPRVSMGTWIVIIYFCFILIQLVLLRGRFRPARLLQILGSFVFGWFVDTTNGLTGVLLPAPANYAVQLVYLVVSMALVGLGILFYLTPGILSLPGEGVTQTVSEISGIALYKCKMAFDVSLVFIAASCSLLGLHHLAGVREGSILAAFGVGKFLGVFTKLLKAGVIRFIDGVPRERRTGTVPERSTEESPQIIPAHASVRVTAAANEI